MCFWNLKSWAVFQFQISSCFFHKSAQQKFHPVNSIRGIQGDAWQLVLLPSLTEVKKFLLPQLTCKCTKPLLRLDLYGPHPTSHSLPLTPKLTTVFGCCSSIFVQLAPSCLFLSVRVLISDNHWAHPLGLIVLQSIFSLCLLQVILLLGLTIRLFLSFP